jgi:hypothetical protein
MSKKDELLPESQHDAKLPVGSSAVLMPCGSNHSCHHCNGYYFGCTWLERMTEEEYEKHEQLVIATR